MLRAYWASGCRVLGSIFSVVDSIAIAIVICHQVIFQPRTTVVMAPKTAEKKPVKAAPKPVKKPAVPKPSKTVAKAQARAAALDAPDVKPKRKHHKPSVVSLQVEVKND